MPGRQRRRATCEERGLVLCERVEVADRFRTRLLGLLPKRELPADEGLWLLPSSGIHTFGMRFPIDVVALDRSGFVLSLQPALRPWRVGALRRGTHSVLELAPGAIRLSGVRVGDRVRVSHAPLEHSEAEACSPSPAL